MGVWHRIYLGPYVRCKNVPQEFSVFESGCGKGCPGNTYKVIGEFCQKCGSKIASVPVKVTRKPVDGSQPADEFQDFMSLFGRHTSDEFKDFDVFVPNRSWDGQPKRRDVSDKFAGEARIKDSDPPTERVRFEMAFQRELAHIRMTYGDQNVEVCWGLLGEFS